MIPPPIKTVAPHWNTDPNEPTTNPGLKLTPEQIHELRLVEEAAASDRLKLEAAGLPAPLPPAPPYVATPEYVKEKLNRSRTKQWKLVVGALVSGISSFCFELGRDVPPMTARDILMALGSAIVIGGGVYVGAASGGVRH